ncbi:antibiotic biosynthesis monooxygenase [Amycolatopsis sp. cg13]|uniref:antibiotic biosynthesis monooxygenase n=1 Tax=Amycolatopsis sp. cg13 TaxID=3238807 RepID=UPI0035244C34
MTEQITAITRFTVADEADAEAFASRFAEQAAGIVTAAGCLGNFFARSARDPRTFANVGWWASAGDHLAVVRGEEFQSHVAVLAGLAKAEPDQFAATGVGTFDGPEPVRGAGEAVAVLALTRFTLHSAGHEGGFREAFEEHAATVRTRDGFLGHTLLRSTIDPLRYVNLGWWNSPAEYLAVLRTPEFAADSERMAGFAEGKGDLFVRADS